MIVAISKASLFVHIAYIKRPSAAYIESSIFSDYTNLQIPGYGYFRIDHLSNKEYGNAWYKTEVGIALLFCTIIDSLAKKKKKYLASPFLSLPWI